MFAVSDVRFDGWPCDRVETAFSLSPHGMLISSPLPNDLVRVVASVSPETAPPDRQDVDDLIQTRGPSWMRKGEVTELLSSSPWRVHERVPSHFPPTHTSSFAHPPHYPPPPTR